MRKIQVLNADIYTGKDNFSQLLSQEYKLRIISISYTLRAELKTESELALKVRAFIDNGKLIPSKLINELFKKEIELDKKDILIVNYPRTESHFFDLIELINNMQIKIEKIWYLKLHNLEYISQKKLIELGQIYTEKYEITTQSIHEKIKEKQEHLSKVIKLWNNDFNIYTVPIDYEKEKNIKSYFSEIIKNA